MHRVVRGRGRQQAWLCLGEKGKNVAVRTWPWGAHSVTVTKWGPRRDWAGSSGHFRADTPGKGPLAPLLTYGLPAGGQEPPRAA